MKTFKIILAFTVFSIIGFFVWYWLVSIGKPTTITPPKNQFTARIETEIDSLNKFSTKIFCAKLYKDIQYRITDYFNQGFFGANEGDNNQWKEILSKNLYSSYAAKFSDQAMFVFNEQEWNLEDLKLIRSELRLIQSSLYLEQNSPIDNKFKEVRTILAKYDEIAGFIFSCSSFSNFSYGIDDLFPDVSDKIQKSRTYLSNNLGNSYVKNCRRLKDGLKNVPQKLFNIHISYLQIKIQQNSNKYRAYTYQSEYNTSIYTPLRNQIDALDKDFYGVSDNAFDSGYNSLETLLSADNRMASDYFFSALDK